MPGAAKLSVVVVVYRMREQAYNTLYSLSAAYQRGVDTNDYEVVVVENNSDANLDPQRVATLGANFRYFLRHETGVSPAPAINFAAAQCNGALLGLIIDGARMLSPGVIAHVLSAGVLFDNPLVAVPGYHLGEQVHDQATEGQAAREQAMLASLDWKKNGYRLFDHACFSPGNARGYFHPFMECSALFCSRASFERLGGADEHFSLPGGGSLNLHMYRGLGMQPENTLVLLPGEGNFHQYHGGVTTRPVAARDELLRAFNDQLNGFWGGQFKALRREPVLLGAIGSNAQRFLETSATSAMQRFKRLAAEGNAPWADDPQPQAPRPIANAPRLSIIVIVYKMRRQAMNTLYSLSAAFQRAVATTDYEVIVVENRSPQTLDAAEVAALGPNFRYFLRDETKPTPVYAINFGVAEARAAHVCLMIDGARMVTPRLVRYTLDLLRLSPHAVVATPGYHIGTQDQKFSSATQHDEAAEIELLERANWRNDGYALFDIACLSGANSHGFLHPLMESNCLTFEKAAFVEIGGAHEGFQTPGGGSVNLDIYRNLVLRRGSWLFVLPGEGTFHQFHGGVTTMQTDDLEAVLASHREELKGIRGAYYTAARREPTLYGAVTGPAMRFLHLSSQAAQRRFKRFEQAGENPWPDDITTGR